MNNLPGGFFAAFLTYFALQPRNRKSDQTRNVVDIAYICDLYAK